MTTTPQPVPTLVALAKSDLDALQARLRGQLVLAGTPAYDEARSLWNAMIDRRPAVVIRCLGVADVREGIRFARETGLPLSIKGGGHNIAGLAVCEGGVLLDMSLMRGVLVDPVARIARAQAGCLLGDVDRETQLHGLAAVLGFVSATGIAGLTLGGGFGYLTRRFGWTTDNVAAMEVVTWDGRIVTASEDENADLFWGLRGGGGNFGVVTRFDFRLHEVAPEIVGGLVAWPAEQAPEVLALYRRLVAEAPPELTAACIMRNAPPAPWLPATLHGKPMVAMAICHSGPLAQAEAEVAKITGFGTPAGNVVQRRSYVSQQAILDATQPKGRRYYWKSEYLPGLSAELTDGALAHARQLRSPHSGIVLFPIGGTIGNLPEDHSPVGNRDAQVVLNITASWETAEGDEANVGWARSAWSDLRRFSTGGSYINFMTEEEQGDRLKDAYRGATWDRLVDVKTAWDPDNVFRCNKNVAPRG